MSHPEWYDARARRLSAVRVSVDTAGALHVRPGLAKSDGTPTVEFVVHGTDAASLRRQRLGDWATRSRDIEVQIETPEIPVKGAALELIGAALHPDRWSDYIEHIDAHAGVDADGSDFFDETLWFGGTASHAGLSVETRLGFRMAGPSSSGALLRYWLIESLAPWPLLTADEGMIVLRRSTTAPDEGVLSLTKRIKVDPDADDPVVALLSPRVTRTLMTSYLAQFSYNFFRLGCDPMRPPARTEDELRAHLMRLELLLQIEGDE